MKYYDSLEGLIRTLRGLLQENRRLREEAAALKSQYEEVLRRFRAGTLAGDKARKLAYAIYDRMRLIRYELIPLVETRANGLYVELISRWSGQLPDSQVKKPARTRGPSAGEELHN